MRITESRQIGPIILTTPSVPGVSDLLQTPSVTSGPMLHERKSPRERVREGVNGMHFGNGFYAVKDYIKRGGFGATYRAERIRGKGPEVLIVKQMAFNVDEALITGEDTIVAYVEDWIKSNARWTHTRRGREKKSALLVSDILDSIHDDNLRDTLDPYINQKHSFGDIIDGLVKFSRSKEGEYQRDKLTKQKAEFLREYAILKFLQDNGVQKIPRIYDKVIQIRDRLGTKNNPIYNYYFAQEEVEGESISGYYQKGGRLVEKEALRVVLGLAETVRGIQELGVIHRDVSHNNVFIGTDAQNIIQFTGLIDFGGALGRDEPAFSYLKGRRELTERGLKPTDFTLLGTNGFIPPEESNPPSRTADTFSIAKILFYLLTGDEPEDQAKDFAQQLEREKGISVDLKHIIAQGAHPDYHKRLYVEDLIGEIHKYIDKNTSVKIAA